MPPPMGDHSDGDISSTSKKEATDKAPAVAKVHTTPFVQSSLQHGSSSSSAGTSKTVWDPSPTKTIPASRRPKARPTETNGNGKTISSQKALKQPIAERDDTDETTPLLGNEFKEPPTTHECDDIVNANEIIQKPVANEGATAREAADELNSILSGSNVLLNAGRGGFSSPATLGWLVKSFVDMYYKYPNLSHVLAILAVTCFVVYFYATSYGQVILSQASSFDLESLTVTGVSDLGVSVHMVTTIRFDYTQVTNWVNRMLGYIAGTMLGEVKVIPLQPLDLFVEIESFDDLHRLARIIPPETSVKLRNGDATTLIVESTIGVISTSAVILSNRLLALRSAGQNLVNITVTGMYNFDVESKVKNYRNVMYDFEESLTLDIAKGLPDDLVEDFSIDLSDDTKDKVKANFYLQTKLLDLPVQFELGALAWDIFIPSCKTSRLLKLGSVHTDTVLVEPLSRISVSGSVELDQFPSAAIRNCGDHDVSPLNQLVKDFLSNKLTRTVQIVATPTKEDTVPVWLRFILERVYVPVPLGLSHLGHCKTPGTDLVKSIGVTDSWIKLDDANGLVLASSMVTATLRYPEFLKHFHEVDVKKFKSMVVLHSNCSKFSEINLGAWQSVSVNYTDDEVVVFADVKDLEIDILEPEVTSNIANAFLSGLSSSVSVNSSSGIDISTPVFDTVLVDLPYSLEARLSGIDSDGVLSNLSTSIINIILIESTADSLKLLMDLEIGNPLQVGIDTRQIPIDLYFASDEVRVGQLRTNDIPVIGPGEIFNASISLDIKPKLLNLEEPERAVAKLEKLLSAYLSGNETALSLIGHGDTIPTFPKLSAVLADMSLDITLPEVGSGKTGFIVSSTMHIMTSEIEFTVYNPVSNSEVVIEILKAQASYEGTTLGHLERQEILIVPPGIYTTPRLPITFATGIGGNILKKALNGDLQVHGDAIFKFRLDEFHLDLVYSGSGLTANVRL